MLDNYIIPFLYFCSSIKLIVRADLVFSHLLKLIWICNTAHASGEFSEWQLKIHLLVFTLVSFMSETFTNCTFQCNKMELSSDSAMSNDTSVKNGQAKRPLFANEDALWTAVMNLQTTGPAAPAVSIPCVHQCFRFWVWLSSVWIKQSFAQKCLLE